MQTLYSKLCKSPVGSNKSCESSWIRLYKLYTPGFRQFIPLFMADPLKDHWIEWWTPENRFRSSGLSTNIWWGLSLNVIEWPETCPKATPVLIWLCAYGKCFAEWWNVSSFWVCLLFGWGFLQGCSWIWLHSSVSLLLPLRSTPHRMTLPPPCFTIGMVLARWCAVPIFARHAACYSTKS